MNSEYQTPPPPPPPHPDPLKRGRYYMKENAPHTFVAYSFLYEYPFSLMILSLGFTTHLYVRKKQIMAKSI